MIAALGGTAVAWPSTSRGQQPKVLRVGYSGMLPRGAPHYAAFEKRMIELGYREGSNFTFEYIQSPGIEGYELTYRELVAREVDILMAAGNESALRAARAARDATPIVFLALDFDPVEKGYVSSLSRPGRNTSASLPSSNRPTPAAFTDTHQRQEAIQRLNDGHSQADVARTFNVSQATVSRLGGSRPFGLEGTNAGV
jgi:CENP-B N-terminal DNA-binding domain